MHDSKEIRGSGWYATVYDEGEGERLSGGLHRATGMESLDWLILGTIMVRHVEVAYDEAASIDILAKLSKRLGIPLNTRVRIKPPSNKSKALQRLNLGREAALRQARQR